MWWAVPWILQKTDQFLKNVNLNICNIAGVIWDSGIRYYWWIAGGEGLWRVWSAQWGQKLITKRSNSLTCSSCSSLISCHSSLSLSSWLYVLRFNRGLRGSISPLACYLPPAIPNFFPPLLPCYLPLAIPNFFSPLLTCYLPLAIPNFSLPFHAIIHLQVFLR